ncbi:MAG TPA: hypothetical protein VL996_13715 [Methylocella sp.]|nr:hypothetical protein [Methylocella sp.]
MTDLSFAEYAAIENGEAFEIISVPDPDSYLADLQMMHSVARGARLLPFAAQSGFCIDGGITLENDVNGLAEKVGDKHFCSVTIGHCLANLYCVETVLGCPALPDFGQATQAPAESRAMVPPSALFDDLDKFQAEMLARRSDNPKRTSVSRFLSHIMFTFVFLHEFFHCALNHCTELEKRNLRPRLREFGTEAQPDGPSTNLLRGFEVSADSHAADGVIICILSKLDIPTRLGYFEGDEFTRQRLALFAMALVIVLWHDLDRDRSTADLYHPSPMTRLLNILDCVFNSSTESGYKKCRGPAFDSHS